MPMGWANTTYYDEDTLPWRTSQLSLVVAAKPDLFEVMKYWVPPPTTKAPIVLLFLKDDMSPSVKLCQMTYPGDPSPSPISAKANSMS